MNFKLFLFICLSSISLLALCSGSSQTLNIFYNFSSSASSVDAGIFQTSSLIFIVETDMSAVCRYSFLPNISYSDMAGFFDFNFGTIHKKSLLNLLDGYYDYYLKCATIDSNSTISYEKKISFKVNAPVTAQILLSKTSPVNSGRLEIEMITSKDLGQPPNLAYYLDGSTQETKIPLYGSGKNWKGYLIISPSVGEAVGSFKFQGRDLEGRLGEEITAGGVFLIDTIKPKTITAIEAIGRTGGIEIRWHFEEKIKKFRIYRSESPNIGYVDFYRDTDNSELFLDALVAKGKMYYYKVSGLDDAGNEADLSKEVNAAALFSNESISSGGLTQEFRGYVDNFISEIEILNQEIVLIKSSFDSKSALEKEISSDLKLDKLVESSISGLASLKKEVENYKLQDLSKNELDNKLSSARLKLSILRKKCPESLFIADKKELIQKIGAEDLDLAILQFNSSLSEDEFEGIKKQSLNLLEENKITITSSLYSVEIAYLDGAKSEATLIKKAINSELEKIEGLFFIEIVPKEIAEKSSDLDFKNLVYEIINDDPVISFESDTKSITYSISKKISPSQLENIKSIPIKISPLNKEGFSLTGYFFYNQNLKSNFGIFFLAIIVLCMLVYLGYLRKNNSSEEFSNINRLLEETSHCIIKKDILMAEEHFLKIKQNYKTLTSLEKVKIFKRIAKVKEALDLEKISQLIKTAVEDRNKSLANKAKNIYALLPENSKKIIAPELNKMELFFEGK